MTARSRCGGSHLSGVGSRAVDLAAGSASPSVDQERRGVRAARRGAPEEPRIVSGGARNVRGALGLRVGDLPAERSARPPVRPYTPAQAQSTPGGRPVAVAAGGRSGSGPDGARHGRGLRSVSHGRALRALLRARDVGLLVVAEAQALRRRWGARTAFHDSYRRRRGGRRRHAVVLVPGVRLLRLSGAGHPQAPERVVGAAGGGAVGTARPRLYVGRSCGAGGAGRGLWSGRRSMATRDC